MAEKLRELTIFSVHGTWGRAKPRKWFGLMDNSGAVPWYDRRSPLFRRVTSDLEAEGWQVVVRPHEWSGANSLSDRLKAGDALAGEISKVAGPVAIVAHSHGGNVALQAASRHPERPILLATLATPFLQWVAVDAPVRHFITGLPTAGMYGLVTWLLLMVLASAFTGPGDLPGSWLTAFGVIALLQAFSHWGLLMSGFPEGKNAECRIAEVRHPLLVLRTADDEAGHAIGFGLALALASSTLVYWFYVAFLLLMLFAVFAGPPLAWVTGDAAWQESIDFITEAAVKPVAALFIGVPALLYPLARLTYGREFFLRGIGTQLIANTVPESDGNLTVRSVPRPAPSAAVAGEPKPPGGQPGLREALRRALPALRHGIHSSEQSGEMIAGWLLRKLGSRNDPAAPA
jgi:pimeloyl-ACP methyl ester carboxylesterase